VAGATSRGLPDVPRRLLSRREHACVDALYLAAAAAVDDWMFRTDH
jgi:hypothetical protein